jgi:hypothetical protein
MAELAAARLLRLDPDADLHRGPPEAKPVTSPQGEAGALTAALNVSSSPMWTGSLNVIRSMPAVTTRQRECLIADNPAASSHIFMTVPPWTKPAELASTRLIQRTRTACDSAAGRGSTTADGYASRSDEDSIGKEGLAWPV